MVIIRITGGLGNQMFQYATGRATAMRNRTKLVLNTAYFEETFNKQAHEKEILNLFPQINHQHLTKIVNSDLANLGRKNHTLFWRNYNKISKILKLPVYFKTVTEERLLQYQPNLHYQRAIILNLAGDWQNERYFIDYESIIREDFTFPIIPAQSPNASILALIQTSNSVALHIRRGDYLLSATHQSLDLEYYKKSILFIQKRVSKPVYFVFSDDIIWCQQNLNLVNAYYINYNTGKQSYIDMQLMSCCKHNIIANSSFSWWGAWLNQNPGKIVIAPEIWLEKASIKSEQVTPSTWIKI